MILTVTPNAAVDKTFRVEGFSLDRVHRPSQAFTVAGGKGINVARVYHTLGGEPVCTGFLGGVQGRIVARAMAEEGLANQFVPCEGETRLCIAVIDPLTGTQTELNESGPDVSMRSVSQLMRRMLSLLSQHDFDFVVLSGSLPPGVPDSLYPDLIGIARERGIRTVLDTSGPALDAGIMAKPWMVKPNPAELQSLKDAFSDWPDDTLGRARRLHESGIEVVVATLGPEGALLVGPGGTVLRSTPPRIDFASAVASGDSFLGAFLWSLRAGAQPADLAAALQLATGAGAANASVIGAGMCSRADIERCAGATIVQHQSD